MKNIFIVYKEFYRDNKILLIIFVLIAMLFQILSIIMPLVLANIIDSAVNFASIGYFLRAVVLAVLVFLSSAVIIPTSSYCKERISIEAKAFINRKIIVKIAKIKNNGSKKKSIRHIIQLINDDSEKTGSLVISDIVLFITNVIYILVVFAIIISINITSSFLMIFLIPLLVITSKIMIPKIQKSRQLYIECREKLNDLVDESYNGELIIKLSNSYKFIANKINIAIFNNKEVSKKYLKYLLIHTELITSNLMNFSNFAITILGAYMVIRGEMSIGSVTAMLAYFSGIYNALNILISFWGSFKVKMISLDRLVQYLELPIEAEGGDIADEFMTLYINDISYSFDNVTVIRDLSLKIDKGEHILITGDNGSGKSTLVRLLVALMSPQTGNILYNGKEITKYNLHSLRDRICYIPSEPYIFSGGLEDNFFGDAISSQLILGDKYSNITKNGDNLSSGEKKRLQLSCGLHQKSDIYILDEPLNFIDEVSKKEIIETIKRDFCDKTLIVISHESMPFNFCETKYVMENGELRLAST